MPKISIIVPCYNAERYLDECLSSICAQTLTDIQIICVDDGSTDESSSIIDYYATLDSRIKVIHKENTGYGNSMNIGIDAVDAEYIGIVESDDWIQQDMMQTLFEAAKLYQADFVKADFYRFVQQSDGNIRKIYNHLTRDSRYYNRVLCPINEIETFKFIMNIWSGIYRTDFIRKNKIRFNETPGASFQDNGFWFQTFALAERVVFLDRPLYMNRRDNPLSSVNREDKVYAACIEYDYIREWIKKIPGDRKCYEYLCSEARIRNYFFTIDRIDDSYKEEFYIRFQKDYQYLIKAGEIAEMLLPASWKKRIAIIIENPKKACELEQTERRCFMQIIGPYKDLIIYGAGAWGKKAWNTLNRIGMRNRIAYFAVTDRKGNPSTLYDIPVMELSSFSDEFKKEALIIIAAKGEVRNQMIQNIFIEGYQHYTDSMLFFD